MGRCRRDRCRVRLIGTDTNLTVRCPGCGRERGIVEEAIDPKRALHELSGLAHFEYLTFRSDASDAVRCLRVSRLLYRDRPDWSDCRSLRLPITLGRLRIADRACVRHVRGVRQADALRPVVAMMYAPDEPPRRACITPGPTSAGAIHGVHRSGRCLVPRRHLTRRPAFERPTAAFGQEAADQCGGQARSRNGRVLRLRRGVRARLTRKPERLRLEFLRATGLSGHVPSLSSMDKTRNRNRITSVCWVIIVRFGLVIDI